MNIAIDGPVAAGKGTVSRKVAEQLGMLFVDTGALYRAISVYCDWKNTPKHREPKVCRLLKNHPPTIELRKPAPEEVDGRLCTALLNDRDISWDIRSPESDKGSSIVSQYLCVRDYLLVLQRSLAAKQDCVMEGRDIGTFVLPDAELKIFLTASVEVRAQRRHLELQTRGTERSLRDVQFDIEGRDREDLKRPLRSRFYTSPRFDNRSASSGFLPQQLKVFRPC